MFAKAYFAQAYFPGAYFPPVPATGTAIHYTVVVHVANIGGVWVAAGGVSGGRIYVANAKDATARADDIVRRSAHVANIQDVRAVD